MTGLARSVGAFDDRQAELFRRMDTERDNLWAALESPARTSCHARGAELAKHLLAYWSSRGQFGDLRRMFMSLASLTPDDSASRAHFLRAAAVMANSLNDIDARESLARESLRVATASDDPKHGPVPAWRRPLAMWATHRGGRAGRIIAVPRAGDWSWPTRQSQWPRCATSSRWLVSPKRGSELGDEGVGSVRSGANCGHAATCSRPPHRCAGDRATGELAEVQARAGAATKHVIDDRSGLQLLLETLAWMAAGGVHARAAILLGSAERVRKASGFEPGCTATATRTVCRSGAEALDRGPMTSRSGAASR